MTMIDSTFDFLVKSFRLKTKELTSIEALKLGANLERFFAVEMNYKGTPVRMIVCATGVPGEILKAKTPAALVEKTSPDEPTIQDQNKFAIGTASAGTA